MAVWHRRSVRKKTGGRTRRLKKSRKYELGTEFSAPELGEKRIVKRRTRGGNTKQVTKRAEHVNLATEDGVKNLKIQSVEENPANPNFVRRSLLTKGTVIQTAEGKAEITSRPGQNGVVNAKLLE
ncbi:30S ribosomal protein S8e [Candidatus Nanohalococcus occultus]|uniref:Small ribosomal subunit protein eS8 n=1 Tax=Candidatus Nanohalococcus occultus TaxID=2978047 RepID=A0ABY8CEW2_9ARCH|nr:Ribosomal protein S8E [Candidatus Nanohaloarchaeota archaeon SVXNc]